MTPRGQIQPHDSIVRLEKSRVNRKVRGASRVRLDVNLWGELHSREEGGEGVMPFRVCWVSQGGKQSTVKYLPKLVPRERLGGWVDGWASGWYTPRHAMPSAQRYGSTTASFIPVTACQRSVRSASDRNFGNLATLSDLGASLADGGRSYSAGPPSVRLSPFFWWKVSRIKIEICHSELSVEPKPTLEAG